MEEQIQNHLVLALKTIIVKNHLLIPIKKHNKHQKVTTKFLIKRKILLSSILFV